MKLQQRIDSIMSATIDCPNFTGDIIVLVIVNLKRCKSSVRISAIDNWYSVFGKAKQPNAKFASLESATDSGPYNFKPKVPLCSRTNPIGREKRFQSANWSKVFKYLRYILLWKRFQTVFDSSIILLFLKEAITNVYIKCSINHN